MDQTPKLNNISAVSIILSSLKLAVTFVFAVVYHLEVLRCENVFNAVLCLIPFVLMAFLTSLVIIVTVQQNQKMTRNLSVVELLGTTLFAFIFAYTFPKPNQMDK